MTIKTISGLTKSISIQQDSESTNLHFSASFVLNDMSEDKSGHLDSVTVFINKPDGNVYNSFVCDEGNAERRYGSADFSEDGGIDIGKISIRYTGTVSYDLQPELTLNGEKIELEESYFPITVGKTLYGENTMELSCEFDYFG